MNGRRAIAVIALLAAAAVPCQAGDIYQEDFDGSDTSPLNGSTPNFDSTGNGVTWIAHADYMDDGTGAASSSAWLLYDFGASVYEVTFERSGTHATQFVGITFDTVQTPPTTYFSSTSYATLAIRGNGDGEFWAGPRSSAGNDLGTGLFPNADGTLRLVLDTTGANWTVDGYFTPASGGGEVTLNLGAATGLPGTQYVYDGADGRAATPETLPTAVGMTASGSFASALFRLSEVGGASVLLGDANNDGVVSADDFAAVQTNFGNTGAADGLLPGDANDDGVVSADDFAAIQTNFGSVLGAAVEAAPIPEPVTLMLLAGAGMLVVSRRKAR